MPQPKDPSRRTLGDKASGGYLSRLFVSPGCLPLEASRGRILRVIAMKRKRFARMEAWRDVSLREDESLARVPPLEGIDQLGEEEIGKGIKVSRKQPMCVGAKS